ncbi:MAG: hypothetical protein ACLQU2_18715 [Candidatus Binataceae bacterium]
MEEDLRTPFFVAALLLIALAVLIEVGSEIVAQLGLGGRIGLGIPYSALVDGLLLYMIILMAMALGMPERLHGLLQGIVTLIVSLLVAFASFIMIFVALFALVEMVGLLLAVPFGTIIYMAVFGSFGRGAASAELSAIMTLKLFFAGCLVAAQQRFLQNKLLVFATALALVATIIVSFLQGLVPGFLVSITDAVAAIVMAVLGLILAIVLLVRSIPAVVKAIV